MKAAMLDRTIEQTPTGSPAALTAPTPATASVTKTAVLDGLCFLTATFTFATGNARIHAHSSNAAPDALVTGVILLGGCALAVAANGAAMRRVLTPQTPIRGQAYFAARVTECLSLVAAAAYLLTSHTSWDAYVVAVYAVSGLAGLVLSSALLTSKIVPRNLSLLGLIGYPVFLAGTILAMFNQIDISHGAGMIALVPGGLFELILPLWLFTRGFSSHQIEA
jgi:hypothetical protein